MSNAASKELTPKKTDSKQQSKENAPELFDGKKTWIAFALLAAFTIPANTLADGYMSRLGHNPKSDIDFSTWTEGSTQKTRLTLVASDEKKLGCGFDEKIEGLSCGFDTRGLVRSGVSAENLIQPFMTAGIEHAIYIAGIWAQPEVAYRAHQETGLADDKEKRFVVECELKVLKTLFSPKIRWKPNAGWGNTTAHLLKAENCTVLPPGVYTP